LKSGKNSGASPTHQAEEAQTMKEKIFTSCDNETTKQSISAISFDIRNFIDRNQARTQLAMLGYKPEDNLYMRFFVPDGDPRHGTRAAARKADKLNWEEVERYQNDGYGVYFVVNGGGHTDKDVQQGRALFCEWDDQPIEDQLFAWQSLNLPEPTMQVGTRKSVHNYWRADLTKEQWIELQEDLLAYTQSDQKLKNPSRVLRLAGAWHIKPGFEPIRCDIIHQSGKLYTYEELRAAIPRRQQSEQPTINYQPSISNDVPLYQFLTKDDRALIDQGATQGTRNNSGAKLARNLIGTAQRLNYLGRRFDGDPRQLFDDYCYRCNPPIASREAETIWKFAQKDNPTPSLTDDALENCAKAWLRNQEKLLGCSFGSSNISPSGSGGSSISSEPTEQNHWNAPVSWNGEIGWLVPTEKPVTETDPKTGEETPVVDGKSKPVTETVMVFFPKCNFDFQIEQELSSVDREDGGGIVLQIKRSIDSEQKRVIIKSVDYGSAKDFETALKKALGDGIVVNLKSDQLKSLIHVRLREYRQRGGRKYRLADRIGQQEDGTWVFENKQFTKDGLLTTQEESGWVYNPQVSPTDAFASPSILDEDPKALRNLIEAQKKVAGSNFMRFLLCDGYVAACLNEQTIVKQEGFLQILNPYGDPGGGKTVAIESALSLAWGNSDKSGMCSATESYLYERLRRYGSIPTLWDDPPSKRREDKEKVDELIKRNYGKFARKVRGSDQQPYSSFIPTTNHSTGDVLPATKSRCINLFFPVTGDLNFEYHPELEDAKAKATGAFRQIISIGYNRPQVREVRARLQKHLPTAHERAAIHLAILTWYTQKVVDLAGVGIDVEDWVIKNLCSELNEAQTGLNSIADFVERFISAKSTSAIGAWNFGLVRTAEQGNCLAIHMPSVWPVIESGDPPPYNRSVLERVLVDKGAIKNKPAKLDRDRDSTLAYQREIHKGRNEGEDWIPSTKPKPVNKKCLLIPERLWGDLGFLLLVPDSPPDDDGGRDLELVTSGNLEVTSSNLEEVTSSNQDFSRASDHSYSTGNLVTKNYSEEEKKENEREAQNDTHTEQWNDSSCVCDEKNISPLQNLVTRLPEAVHGSETLENNCVEAVTQQGYQQVTQAKKEVTREVTELDFSPAVIETNEELKRLGWTSEQGKKYLLSTYGVRSRMLLSEEQLEEFLKYLKAQPNLPHH
jgi:hypothetical protein